MSVRSFITLRHLTPKPWDLVTVFWARLLQWARQKDVIVADPDARVSETMYGTRVVFEPRFPWDHPFRVSVSGRNVVVRPGYLDDEMPILDGIHLDGLDADGVARAEPVYQIPDVAHAGPDGRSHICLIMVWDVESRAPNRAVSDWLTIGHVSDLAFVRVEAGGYIAYEPLAVCYWDAARTKITHTRQVVHHNLKHQYLPGASGGPGKHFFSAV